MLLPPSGPSTIQIGISSRLAAIALTIGVSV
jgi:hypothetical protein